MGLTEDQKTIVKATVPILETGGEALTRHFYGLMLSEFPEVVPFFNKTHQKSGDQPRALAHSVLMYAKHIDHLENLGPVAAQIVNKHVSLAVRADHYPIVGSCLIRAIREVLGADVATDAVLDAWGAAYQQLADILIAAEEAVYKKNEESVGGWRNDRDFTIGNKVVESSEIVSLYLTPADHGKVLTHQPGQYLCVHAVVDGNEIRRNYSLSALSNGINYRISIKREDGGTMSNYLHNLDIGAHINLIPPAGEFILMDSEKPLVLIAGGIGITPLLPMMEHALRHTTRPVTLIYCCRNRDVQAFASKTVELWSAYPDRTNVHNWFSKEHGHITEDQLQNFLPETRDIDVYFTGPKSFMADIYRYVTAFGVPASQIHHEFFGPTQQFH